MLSPFPDLIRHKHAGHFTASGVVIARAHILLVKHRRIGAWLPPGGHIELEELPHQAAVREVWEETGVAVNVLSEPRPETGLPNAFFLPQPLCIQAVYALEKGMSCYHFDLVYLCHCQSLGEDLSLPDIVVTDEVSEAKWVALEEVSKLPLASNVSEILEMAKTKLLL